MQLKAVYKQFVWQMESFNERKPNIVCFRSISNWKADAAALALFSPQIFLAKPKMEHLILLFDEDKNIDYFNHIFSLARIRGFQV